MKLKEMLDLWIKITGVNPNEKKTHYTIHFSDRISDWDVEKMNEKIQEALGYDETGLFAEAYLCHYFNEYIKQRGFCLTEYIDNPAIKDYLNDVCRLYDGLQKSNADKLIMDEAQKAMDFYKLKADRLSVFDIAEIRTCANNCMDKNLHTIQFVSGDTQKDSFKMSRDILMYKNIDALIVSAAEGNIDGVSMAYIRDEKQITNSYFAFVIKNGNNLYLLTDKPVFVHPLQSSYSRCPGRDMHRRIDGNLFPYESVAKIDVSDLWGSGRYGTRITDNSLSVILREGEEEKLCKKIGSIDEMNQCEAFWFVLMLALIKERFYDKVAPQMDLSYVGSQINHPDIATTEHSLIVQRVLPSISIKPISYDETNALTYDKHYEEKLKSNWNQYIIDRYKDKVPETVLNITHETDTKYLPNTDDESFDIELKQFDIMDVCGTEEEIKYNQKWIGRYNYAKVISEFLRKDYEKNANQIYIDVRRMMLEHLEETVTTYLIRKDPL